MMVCLSVGLFLYICWILSVWKLALDSVLGNLLKLFHTFWGVFCMIYEIIENVYFGFFVSVELSFTYSLIFFTFKSSLFCLCLFLVSWMQCLTLLRILWFFFSLFWQVFPWVALFPLSSFIFCFSLCLLSKSFFFQVFDGSWVSAHLIVKLSKSNWKPCVCFLWTPP